ncbi:hypothetical protein LNP20_20385 [Klebsiella pneumoniae subsp. pneumoniae]|nr:hypothetical protein [Klebsiella pneumoniae subsp. pneumoniae]
MQALKIAVIGGGSSYTPELIEGIIVRYEQLPVTELALVDVESGRDKVEIIAALTRRMLKHKGLEQVAVSVHFTLDEAIRGASFVLTQLRVGQLAARAADERLGLKYHLLGQETTGVGGFAKALRTIPVILEVRAKWNSWRRKRSFSTLLIRRGSSLRRSAATARRRSSAQATCRSTCST